MLYWKQRYHIKVAVEGGKTLIFFMPMHPIASARILHVLEQDNIEFFAHDAKAKVLHDFYANLLGAVSCSWSFSLADLYLSHP